MSSEQDKGDIPFVMLPGSGKQIGVEIISNGHPRVILTTPLIRRPDDKPIPFPKEGDQGE